MPCLSRECNAKLNNEIYYCQSILIFPLYTCYSTNFFSITFPSLPGTLNDKTHLLQQPQQEDSNDLPENILNSPPDGMNKVFCAILSSPGEIVSFSILLHKGLFRRHTVNTYTGKKLMVRAADEMSLLHLGQVVTFTIPGNNSKVVPCKHDFTFPGSSQIISGSHVKPNHNILVIPDGNTILTQQTNFQNESLLYFSTKYISSIHILFHFSTKYISSIHIP